ncbi:MAG: hypothetical protein R3E65_06615 [Steroidobacteraceae bacterium]
MKRQSIIIGPLAAALLLAGCSSLDVPKWRWPFAAKPVVAPDIVDEIVFESPQAGSPVTSFPQYFRRNTLVIDMTGAGAAGSVVMRPKTAAGWPVRVSFRVKPGSFAALEITAEQRVLLPVVGAARRPTLDLPLPPSFLKARSDDPVYLRWGAATNPQSAPIS